MTDKLITAPHIIEIVQKLQEAGYEAYIVGGAIRDMMLGRVPKDYDISTSATPEETRAVFGRRNARIIGRRFTLVHLRYAGDLIEISTFRRAPEETGQVAGKQRQQPLPENMIFRDNEFGSAEEDAWRRDFTVNALFFDPVKNDLIDFTGFGIEDMHNGVVRAIGDPQLRFEEDPVRLLRALKLVGQYGFVLEDKTEKALRENLELILHASTSRLSLELEKILKGAYGHSILTAFQEYGFLKYYLPYLAEHWESPWRAYAIELLTERNRRVEAGLYRNSISIAMAALALPFIEAELGPGERGRLWTQSPEASGGIRALVLEAFKPHNMIKRLTISAQRILNLQPVFHMDKRPEAIQRTHGYAHARELMLIQNELVWNSESLPEKWPYASHRKRRRKNKRRPRKRTHFKAQESAK
jgi:poly(A) polymerase